MESKLLSRFPKHVWFVGAAVFCAAFALQLALWLTAPNYIDEKLWFDVAVKISHGTFPGFDTPTPAHPGTAMLLPEALALHLPLDQRIAYHIGLSTIMAIVITLSALVCYRLRPKSWWWLCTVILLAGNSLYPEATAPSSYATVLTVLFVLLVLLAREREGDSESLALLGLCGGVLSATRLDTGVFLLAISFLYLWRLSGKRAIGVLAIAALYFVLLDPYLYINAYEHVHEFFLQIKQNRYTENPFDHTKYVLLLPSLGFFFAFVYVYLRPRLTSIKKDYLLWLLAITEALCALLIMSRYHPMRYFLPLMSVWEVFLALFALEYVASEPDLRKLPIKPEYLVVGFFIAARALPAALLYATYDAHFTVQDLILDWASIHLHW